MLVAVFGNVAHAKQRALADGGIGNVLAAEVNAAAFQGLQTGNAVDQLGLAVAVDTGNTNDFACPNLEGNIVDRVFLAEPGGHGHVLHIQNHLGRLGSVFLHRKFHITAYHHAGKLRFGGGSNIHSADVLALAHNRAAVCHCHDLVEFVGNEQDGLALCR